MADNYIFLPETRVNEYGSLNVIREIYFGDALQDGLFGKRGEAIPFAQSTMFYGDNHRGVWYENMSEWVDSPRRIRWDPNFNRAWPVIGGESS